MGQTRLSQSRIDRDARPTCVRRTDAARGRERKPGEPGKGCSITGRAANGRRPPQAVHTLFAVPHQVAASAKRPPRTSCRRNQGEKRMNPVMKVPCQNRPHLLPTGRRSGGQGRVAAGWRRGDEAQAGGRVYRRARTSGGGEEQERQQDDEGRETGEQGHPILLHTKLALYQPQPCPTPKPRSFRTVSTAPPPSLRSRKPPESRQSCADCRFSPDLRPLFAGPGASTGAPRPSKRSCAVCAGCRFQPSGVIR